MKERYFKVDINKLDTDELEQLAAIFYRYGTAEETKQINDRIAFLNGWMTEEKEAEHLRLYCY